MLTASVVVSCYNQEKYIVDCLNSILSQIVDFEYEVIVSDDCSTDGTQGVLREYCLMNSNELRLFLQNKNFGAAKNYTFLHNKAQGDIVFHFDGDDIMLPGKLQRQYDLFMDNDNLNIVFHKAEYFSDDGAYHSLTQYPNIDDGVVYFSLSDLARWGTIAVHSSYAYRRSSRKIRDLDREFMEWFFAMDSLMPDGVGAFINECYVLYRCNIFTGSYTASKAGRIKAYTIYIQDILYYFSKYRFLRSELYANLLITSLSMFRSTGIFSKKLIFYMLRNIFYFRFNKTVQTFKLRQLVGPKTKIR